jgi:peptidoglycan/xylan/chitin deacetylase (PgdA/CDA1 family)
VARPIYGGIGSVLCLHRVITEGECSIFPDNRALEITPDALRAILSWVRAQGLEPISLDDLPVRLATPSRRKFVCFLFDDGYRDNFVNALPIFREFQVPFAVSLTTGFINGLEPVWWYELQDFLTRSDHVRLNYRGENMVIRCAGNSEKVEAFERLAAMVRACTLSDRGRFLDSILPTLSSANMPGLIMNWDEIRALSGNPLVTICAHTVGHHSLNRLSEIEVSTELVDSKREIEEQLGRSVKHFAFPFGGRNAVGEREFRLAREAGFQTAFTTRNGNLFPEHARFLNCLPRLVISGNWDPLPLLEQSESGLLPARKNGWRRVTTD